MNRNNIKILVVDDEEDIIEFISYNLKKEGFNVRSATNGIRALEVAKEFEPELILLDIMMPEMDGIETCEHIRAVPSLSNCMVAFLTARAEDFSQLAGFSAGADDYITKPVSPRVLISRIEALLNKSVNAGSPVVSSYNGVYAQGDLVIDSEQHLVIAKGNPIEVPKKEFRLLLLLSSKPSRLFTRDEIFQHLWGQKVFVSERTIDVYIKKLRDKIGANRIKTVKGMGYKFIA